MIKGRYKVLHGTPADVENKLNILKKHGIDIISMCNMPQEKSPDGKSVINKIAVIIFIKHLIPDIE